jgi:hypothetical protein
LALSGLSTLEYSASMNMLCWFCKTPGVPTLGNMIFWISKETSTLLESPSFSLEMNLNKDWS